MLSLTDYQIDPVRGFLPSEDPSEILPNEFLDWEQIAANMSSLLMAYRLRAVLDKLQPLDVSVLREPSQLRRAMLLLSVFANAYVWGGESPSQIIPSSISIPLCQVAQKVGRPPILSHASIVLDNWRKLDKNQPIELGNITTLQLLLGGLDEQWFYLATVAMEATGAASLKILIEIQTAVMTENSEAVAVYLTILAEIVIRMQNALMRISDRCDPYIFYHRVRPFLTGWSEPGVIYQGISNTPIKLAGGSAAQSSLVQSLDAGLGIKHPGKSSCEFLHQMRLYMPPLHRRFIEKLESGGTLVRDYIINHGKSQLQLDESYNYCVEQLQKFRKKHMEIAADYILRQNSQQRRGTGGTNFMQFLKRVEVNTYNSLIR